MHEMHLKHPGFTYIVCVPFTKNKERIQKFIETRDIFNRIYLSKRTRYSLNST